MSYTQIKQDVLKTLGYFWLRLFQNTQFVESFTKTLSIHLADLERISDELPTYSARTEMPVFDDQEMHLFRFREADLDRAAHHFGDAELVYGDSGVVYGQQLQQLERWSYPIDVSLNPTYLAGGFAAGNVWQRGIDYTIANGRIIFRQDPLTLAIAKFPKAGIDGTTTFEFLLWGFKTERDYQAVKDFYGVVAGVAAESSEVYQQAVNIAWDLRTLGASIENIKRLFSLAAQVDYVDQAGTIEDIFPEGDRICVQTENSIFTAPIGTLVLVPVGTVLAVGDVIFDAFAIRQSTEDVDFADFEALLLGSGFLGLNYQSALLIPNATVTVSKHHGSGWTYVEYE